MNDNFNGKPNANKNGHPKVAVQFVTPAKPV
jgi:hypothetical protein